MCTHLNWYGSRWFLQQNFLCNDSVALLAVEILDEWNLPPIFYGAAAQRGSWPRSWGFKITQNDAPQSVGLLWSSDQLVAETCTWHNTHKGQISMLRAIQTHISAGERPQTYALDREVTGIGCQLLILSESVNRILCCNLIVAPSVNKLSTYFGNELITKYPLEPILNQVDLVYTLL
jgi:hypothetical protein